VAEYEFSLARGTHGLVEGDFCHSEPSEVGHTLGRASDSFLPEFMREERRQRMIAALLNRLQVEKEMEPSCGTSGPAKDTPSVGVLACV
jgi:hypothetical protein